MEIKLPLASLMLFSKCKLKKEDILFLIGVFENKQAYLTLLYSGSAHGWNAIDFHSRCDDKGSTISLFQIKDSDCIGGFTSAQWTSPQSYEDKQDDTAILFDLTNHRSFPLNKGRHDAIRCEKSWGPTFGRAELSAYYEPFNADNACSSWAKGSSYNIPANNEGINKLTNQKCRHNGRSKLCEFIISELEVWGVVFKQ